MKPLFQLSTRSYEKEIPLIKKALNELESICKVQNGFQIGPPENKLGWNFFNVEISLEMLSVIETSGMMEGAGGYRFPEQLTNFLGHFLELRGSKVRIKIINY